MKRQHRFSAKYMVFIFAALFFSGVHKPRFRQGKDHALLFAVNDYAYDKGLGSWPDLKGPISDAEEIARDIKDFYEFEVEIVKDPTIDDIAKKISEYRDKQYGVDGQLFIFFSGHGHFIEDQKEGFFIPKDGKKVGEDPTQSTWLSLVRLPRLLNSINCPHIFVAIDACYSGTISNQVALKSEGDGDFDRPVSQGQNDRVLADLLRTKSRIFCSSGGKERTPDPSEFASRLKEALRSLGGRDEMLSMGELEEEYLSKATPRPQMGNFEGHEPGGKFLFIYKGLGAVPKPSQPFGPNLPNPNKLKNDRESWLAADKSGTLEAYQKYLKAFPSGEFSNLARTKINKIDEDMAWTEAKGKGTIEGYRNFMKRFPNSAYKPLAEENIKKLNPGQDNNTDLNQDKLKSSDFVRVNGGQFDMGDMIGDGQADEKPVHKVRIDPFEMGKKEVSIGEFRAFITDSKYVTQAEQLNGSYIFKGSEYVLAPGVDWRHDEFGRIQPDDRYPVVHVSWFDVVYYCNWLSKQNNLKQVYKINGNDVQADWSANGYRLPTEAEWEYTARSGGKPYQYAWGNGSPKGNIGDESLKARYPELNTWTGYNDGYASASKTGAFEQGDWGICDMTGNVWEWCWDWYGPDYYAKTQNGVNPRGPVTGEARVLKGGHWRNSQANLRTFFRGRNNPEGRNCLTGFRICRNL